MPRTILTADQFKQRYGNSVGSPTRISADEFEKRYGKKNRTSEPQLTERQEKDIRAQQEYGATFRPNTEDPGIGEALKPLGNVPASAFNLGRAVVDWLNPVTTIQNLMRIPGEFQALKQELGGGLKGEVASRGAFLKEIATHSIPEIGRSAFNTVTSLAKGDVEGAGEQFDRFHRSFVSDPLQVLPLYGAFRAPLKGTRPGAAVDSVVTKTSDTVTRPIRGAGRTASNTARFSAGQAIGIQPETISQITSRPRAFSPRRAGEFTRDALATEIETRLAQRKQKSGITLDTLASEIEQGVARGRQRVGVTPDSLGREIQSALDQRLALRNETGRAYDAIRQVDEAVPVSKNWIDRAINEHTGLIKDKSGKWKPSPSSKLRDASDVRAYQYLYDLYKPAFERGTLTRNEFLNFRADLAGLARYDRQIGKSTPVENTAKSIRSKFNEQYRDKIEGLKELDSEFSKQAGELKSLRKGLVDREGRLTDTGAAKITKAIQDRPNLAKQLDEIVPGIVDRIRDYNRQIVREKGLVDRSGNITDAGYRKISNIDLTKQKGLVAQLESISPGISKRINIFQKIKRLGKGLVDDQGNITDIGMTRIARATGKNKSVLLEQLEEISPGIAKKIQITRAIEDIQSATGIKVGLYSRSILVGGSFLAGPIQGLITAIVTSPEFAVPLLRRYGLIKNSQVVKSVLNGLRAVNEQLPNMIIPGYIDSTDVEDFKPAQKRPDDEDPGPSGGSVFGRRDEE